MRELILKCALVGTAGMLLAAQGGGSGAMERPVIVGVAHIALRTNDMAGAREFYGHVLGFRETSDGRFGVNQHQEIQVFPNLTGETQDRLINIAFETANARQLRSYLSGRGVTVPETVSDKDGTLWFEVRDPEGHAVEFVQYAHGALPEAGDKGISQRIIHVGVTVQDREAEDRFYRDLLGFKETWHGGMKDDRTDWVDMRVPDGTDWLEYMLNVHNPSPHTLGVMHHLALGVPDIQAGYRMVLDRGYKPKEPPQIGRDGKWQLNLYDPNFTRVELMEPKPVRAPCCSPIT
jgi:catechol 2,3-dioxygenase-like lactoylglutathione lyase family enzyme